MSTRGAIGIVKNGEFKVAQYVHYSSSPNDTGKEILQFFKGDDGDNVHAVSVLFEKVDKLRWIDEKRLNEIEKITRDYNDKRRNDFDYLQSGAEILNFVYNEGYYIDERYDEYGKKYVYKKGNGIIEGLINSESFFGDSLFCEWAYVIDLDKNTFEVYRGANKKLLTEKDRFYYLQNPNEEYKPVKLVAEYDLSDLPKRITINK